MNTGGCLFEAAVFFFEKFISRSEIKKRNCKNSLRIAGEPGNSLKTKSFKIISFLASSCAK